jgi:hypothetical protein
MKNGLTTLALAAAALGATFEGSAASARAFGSAARSSKMKVRGTPETLRHAQAAKRAKRKQQKQSRKRNRR